MSRDDGSVKVESLSTPNTAARAAVLLDYEQYQALLAQLRALVRNQAAARVEEAGGAPLLDSLVAMAEDLGIDDLAEQHDYYLYGTEKN